jgi:hypothetical protein
MNTRSYKTKKFAKFARELKKKGLWNKFRLLEYYFQIYKNPTIDVDLITNALEEKIDAFISDEFGYTCFETVLEDGERVIRLEDFFEYFEIH